MKVTKQDLKTIETGLIIARRAAGLHPQYMLTTRDLWDLFHRAWGQGAIDGNDLYKRYNDAHIETAMKSIFR